MLDSNGSIEINYICVMIIVFRTDSSYIIGAGHVMRCLTLAETFYHKGATVVFICRETDGNLNDLILERGFTVKHFPASSVEHHSETPLARDDWKVDAEHTNAAIMAIGGKVDWLVVDHYALGKNWECAVYESVDRIMVIDDLADREHECDLLLDQNLVPDMHIRYSVKVPVACNRLLGPEYSLLQPIYTEIRASIQPRGKKITNLFIFFGGADRANLAGRSIAAFLSLDRPDIHVDVVVSSNSQYVQAIEREVVQHKNIVLHKDLPTLAPLMAKADLAIGACGATSWERLCLGLPTLVVTLAENQRPVAEELNKRGLVYWLGHQEEVDESSIRDSLARLVKQGFDEVCSRRCLDTVEGNGTSKVCAAMTVNDATSLNVRYAQLEDELVLLEWANDLTTRQNAFSQGQISMATHNVWFNDHLCNTDGCHFYIVETQDGVALGQVRFERHDQSWEVHFSVSPIFRGRGLGRRILEAALSKFRGIGVTCTVVFGQVKSGNRPSCRVFESMGFEILSGVRDGVVMYQLEL